MAFMGQLIALILVSLILLANPLPQTETTYKIGAWGDDSSRGNFGVQVEIQTHSYDTPPNTLDYFWVGDDLSNGAFIQFGYSMEPGSYCLMGAFKDGNLSCLGHSESIAPGDARWQWQYWPDRFSPSYFFEIGPRGSAGENESTHTYTILPSRANSWAFTLDGRSVANTTFTVSNSSDPVFIVAEGSASNVSRSLGPVKFQNLSYFDGQGWRQVDSLVALSYCGISVACAANEYGAVAVGEDSLVVGSNLHRADDGTVLWTHAYRELQINVHPDTQFIVTSPLNTNAYVGQASIEVPDGMFAYVSLSDATTGATGVSGWLGGQDRFQGWTGSVSSQNLTIRVLMNSDRSLTATWNTDSTLPTIITLIALAAAAMIIVLARRSGRPETQANRAIADGSE
jgi:hypothetical protein